MIKFLVFHCLEVGAVATVDSKAEVNKGWRCPECGTVTNQVAFKSVEVAAK
jgi:hypothetical protein